MTFFSTKVDDESEAGYQGTMKRGSGPGIGISSKHIFGERTAKCNDAILENGRGAFD